MARRRRAEKRELTPDVRYNDVLVTQFINYMMLRGKRTLSEKLFYSALDMIHERSGEDGIEVFRSVNPDFSDKEITACRGKDTECDIFWILFIII